MGLKKFCPNCGTDLQQQKTAAIGGRMNNNNNNNSIGIQHTGGDVFGTGISGSGNITAKDTKGNIIYFNIASISQEQLKNIITSSTTLIAIHHKVLWTHVLYNTHVVISQSNFN